MWKPGDKVARKSYGKDLCFVVVDTDDDAQIAILKGLNVRLLADAPLSDLEAVTEDELREFEARAENMEHECMRLIQTRRTVDEEKRTLRSETRFQANPDFFERPGRVLHLDGDGTYLQKCMQVYRELGIRAMGQHVLEAQMPAKVRSLLEE